MIAAERAAIAVEGAAGDGTAPAVELLGEQAVSHWSYADVEGVDLWTFDGDRITVKDAYRRIRPAGAAG